MHKLDSEARKILDGKNFIFLATVNPNGTPQVTPTWVDTDGDYIVINTAIGRVKHKNVGRNPQVALAITEQDNPYKLMMIRGRVVEQITGRAAEDHNDKMAKKYTGKEKFSGKPGEHRVLLKIEPHRVSWMR